MAGRGSVIVGLSKKGIGQSCLEYRKSVFIGGETMIQIFDLIRRGYSFKVLLGISFEFSEQYNGYLLIFYNRPKLIWDDQKIATEDDIPF